MSEVSAAEVYPRGGGRPAFQILDVRAPIEVARGALPGALNLPILDDAERRQVGLRYREAGQEAAIELGFRLTEAVMPERVAAWRRACAAGGSVVACWRGGLRSRLAQSFIDRREVLRVEGGYKALRAHLVGSLEGSLAPRRTFVIGGLTGSGKTELLQSLDRPGLLALDLERLANHRGSAFGSLGAQPAQQTFENELSARLLLDPGRVLLVEDESRRIGSLHLPEPLYRRLADAPVLLLEAPVEERVRRIHREYILEPGLKVGPEAALAALLESTLRLRPRLGGALVERLCAVLRAAFAAEEWRLSEALEPFVRPLLEEYYDPLYRRALERSERQVAARGPKEELELWLGRLP